MEVTTAMIKELRQTTGAGILDCRKALESSAGDFESAATYLREKGLAAAAKPTIKPNTSRTDSTLRISMKPSLLPSRKLAASGKVESGVPRSRGQMADGQMPPGRAHEPVGKSPRRRCP